MCDAVWLEDEVYSDSWSHFSMPLARFLSSALDYDRLRVEQLRK